MDKHKVYCSECIFLEERPTLAEVPIDSGNYVITGTRFYCPVQQRWFAVSNTRESIGFNWCIYGKREADAKMKGE